jgi:hypothetical protein
MISQIRNGSARPLTAALGQRDVLNVLQVRTDVVQLGIVTAMGLNE